MVAIDGVEIATFERPQGALNALPLGGSSFTPREVILTSEFQARGRRLVVPIEGAKLHLGSYKALPHPACQSVLSAPTTSMHGHLHACVVHVHQWHIRRAVHAFQTIGPRVGLPRPCACGTPVSDPTPSVHGSLC